MAVVEVLVPYHRYARVLKFLTISLLGYVVTAVIVRPDWGAVIRSVAVPTVRFDAAFLAAMVAVMGTTITPYLFFWQASEEVEEEREQGEIGDFGRAVLTREISQMRRDTYTGMALANVVFLSIVVTTAYVFHENGVTTSTPHKRRHSRLRPLAGRFASLLFTLGIVGVGSLAVPVLAGSSAYAVAELLNWHEGLGERFRSARGFYLVIIVSMLAGMAMNFVGINPIRALYYAAILNGCIAPILMALIFRIGRDARVMGEFTRPDGSTSGARSSPFSWAAARS